MSTEQLDIFPAETSDPDTVQRGDDAKGAVFSACGLYRYQLWRVWDPTKPVVVFVMLNPSKADHQKDDSTIIRCQNFAKSWNCGGVYVINLFAFRSTYPTELLQAEDPIGTSNLSYQLVTMHKRDVDSIVVAWGNSPIVRKLQKSSPDYLFEVFGGLPLYHMGLSKDGTPKHPLYLKSDTLLAPFKLDDYLTTFNK